MASLLSPADIKKVMATFAAPDSFNHAQFFVLAGLKNQNIEKLKDIFHLLDRNQTGFIEKNELSFMMRIFSPEGRLLTDAETNRMMAAGDKDQDGKLGVDGGYPSLERSDLAVGGQLETVCAKKKQGFKWGDP
ncbi:Parvalbumin alpha [Varanus komodoensis]|nr:Parvalbumin alpha [Varanus komodoensis]